MSFFELRFVSSCYLIPFRRKPESDGVEHGLCSEEKPLYGLTEGKQSTV
jgi:hypothetical protein